MKARTEGLNCVNCKHFENYEKGGKPVGWLCSIDKYLPDTICSDPDTEIDEPEQAAEYCEHYSKYSKGILGFLFG